MGPLRKQHPELTIPPLHEIMMRIHPAIGKDWRLSLRHWALANFTFPPGDVQKVLTYRDPKVYLRQYERANAQNHG